MTINAKVAYALLTLENDSFMVLTPHHELQYGATIDVYPVAGGPVACQLTCTEVDLVHLRTVVGQLLNAMHGDPTPPSPNTEGAA